MQQGYIPRVPLSFERCCLGKEVIVYARENSEIKLIYAEKWNTKWGDK